MKNHHNQPPKHNKLVKRGLALLLGVAGLGGATAGVVAYQQGEAKKEAAIERQLETIIDPEIDARGSEALAKYNAQPNKEKGNIKLEVDAKKGVAKITGHAQHTVEIGGKSFGNKFSDMKIVMGLSNGKPNPDDTRVAWYRTGESVDGNITAQEVQFTAPGTEEYRSGTLPGDGSDGWSAAYGGVVKIGGGKTMGSQASTDNRTPWAGEPNPRPPEESAHSVIEKAQTVAPAVLAELAITNS